MKKIIFLDKDLQYLNAVANKFQGSFPVKTFSTLEELEADLDSDVVTPDYIVVNYRDFPTYTLDLVKRLEPGPKVFIVSPPLDKNELMDLIQPRLVSYLEKPCSVQDIYQKIQLLTQNQLATKTQGLALPTLGINFNCTSRTITTDHNSVSLSPTESKILSFLLERNSQVISREELSSHLWGSKKPGKNVLDTHLFNLKKKVPQLDTAIRTIYGNGLYIEY